MKLNRNRKEFVGLANDVLTNRVIIPLRVLRVFLEFFRISEKGRFRSVHEFAIKYDIDSIREVVVVACINMQACSNNCCISNDCRV